MNENSERKKLGYLLEYEQLWIRIQRILLGFDIITNYRKKEEDDEKQATSCTEIPSFSFIQL
jgi:hypothetical protein